MGASINSDGDRLNRASLELLLQYNKWANAQLLKSLYSLNDEQFRQAREKLAHILFWEEIWLMRWKGNAPDIVPDSSELPDIAAFEKRWQEHQFDVRNFFAKMSDKDLQEVIAFGNLEGKEESYVLWRMMFHTLNHSTHHRGQINAMLRAWNVEPPELDFLDFLYEGATEHAIAKTENPWE